MSPTDKEEFGEVEELDRGFWEQSTFLLHLPKEKGFNIFPFSKHICSYVKSPLKYSSFCFYTIILC